MSVNIYSKREAWNILQKNTLAMFWRTLKLCLLPLWLAGSFLPDTIEQKVLELQWEYYICPKHYIQQQYIQQHARFFVILSMKLALLKEKQ